jgi:hypothetical protein
MKNNLLKLILLLPFLVTASFAHAEKYPDFCEEFTREIYRGNIGEDVKQLQIVLNSEGFKNVPVSGFFGYETAQAIRKIQTDNGRYPFGKIGPDTYKLLKNLWCKYEPEPVILTDMIMSIYPTASTENSVTVAWETTNASSCTLNSSAVTLKDTKTFSLNKKMKLNFSCLDSKNQTVKKEIVINPGQSIGLPPVLNASMDPSSLEVGGQATIKWLSVNTDSCNVDGVATTTKGTMLFSAKTINPTLKIVCTGSGREVSKVLGAGVSGDPVGIKYFNSEKYGINLETECKNAPEQFSQKTNRIFGTQAKTDNPCLGNTYISWSTLGTKSCTMTGPGFKNKPTSLIGGENINVKNFDNLYQLNCIKNDNQIVSQDLTVKGIYYERVLVSSNITSDKSSYLPGEKVNFVVSVKNDTGKDLNYFTSYPCIESSPFSVLVNGKSIDSAITNGTNACTKPSTLESFKTLKAGEVLSRNLSYIVPKDIEPGPKEIKIVLSNNLFGLKISNEGLNIFMGSTPLKFNNPVNQYLDLSISTDKKEYYKGEEIAVSIRYKNLSASAITISRTLCGLYDGHALYVNGVDFYTFFNERRWVKCINEKNENIVLQPGEYSDFTYRAFIDNKQNYSSDSLTLRIDTLNNFYLDPLDTKTTTFKILANKANVSVDKKQYLSPDQVMVSWVNSLYATADGVYFDLLKKNSVTGALDFVKRLAKVPDTYYYFTQIGKLSGVNLDVATAGEYAIKAVFFESPYGCLDNCAANIPKAKILGDVTSDVFSIVTGTATTLSSDISIVSKLEKYIKIKVSGKSCESVVIDWGEGSTENLILAKTSSGNCEAIISHTYSTFGQKTITKTSASGVKSEFKVNIN